MEETQFSRTELLIGKSGIEKLKNSKVIIFGIGGVGSYVCEGLARVGIGNFTLVDNDEISESNINRQIHATHKTVGMDKVVVEKERILDINPNAKVEVYKTFYLPGNDIIILDNSIDYIIDAIDTVTAKIELIKKADELKIPIISSMGTGNKLDPTKLEITDINKTSVCPLAKVIRKKLKESGIKKLKVVYSNEEPKKTELTDKNGKTIPGSISFVPSVAGLIIASEVVKDLINKEER